MKVLYVASEAYPFVKFGGLGDVAGSLPKYISRLGVNVDLCIPMYSNVPLHGLKTYKAYSMLVPYDGNTYNVDIIGSRIPNSDVDTFLFRSPEFYVGNSDEVGMFCFFSKCVVEFLKIKFNTYDLIHCNDWHTGLIPHLLEQEFGKERPATVITIHNLSYQGVTSPKNLNKLGIDENDHPILSWDVSDGDLNLLLEGISSADFVNTVSHNYAKELINDPSDNQLTQVLKSREGRFIGILNGIDYDYYPREFSIDTVYLQKKKLKDSLCHKMGFSDPNRPLLGFVSRFDPNQKGLDILYESLKDIVLHGANIVILGSGNKEWEEKFTQLSSTEDYKKYIKTSINFDLELAFEIYKSSDFILVPSKFEPCGLVQLISMWYGTLPIVHAVGGLKDTVSEGKTGYIFDAYSSSALIKSVSKALKIYSSPIHNQMVINAMNQDFGYKKTAQAYIDLYSKAVQIKDDTLNWS